MYFQLINVHLKIATNISSWHVNFLINWIFIISSKFDQTVLFLFFLIRHSFENDPRGPIVQNNIKSLLIFVLANITTMYSDDLTHLFEDW